MIERHGERTLRATPLLRVKAKITVKFTVCSSLPLQHTALLTVTLAFTFTGGAALTYCVCHSDLALGRTTALRATPLSRVKAKSQSRASYAVAEDSSIRRF